MRVFSKLNIENLKIEHVMLYFTRKDGSVFEVTVNDLQFTKKDKMQSVGGGAISIDGVISTRRGYAAS